MKRPRLRKWAKWGFAASMVVWIALGAGTSRWFIEWRSKDLSRDKDVLVWKGILCVSWGPPSSFSFEGPPSGFSMGRTRFLFRPMNPWRWKPEWTSTRHGTGLSLPIWLPTLVSLAGFASLAELDRRAGRRQRLGQCASCDYDRRGLAPSTPCPECGTAPKPG